MAENTSDPKGIRKSNARAERRRKRMLDNYRQVLATAQGRFVFNDILEGCFVNRSAWSNSGMEIHRNVGRQEVGVGLRETLLEADAELFYQLEREARALVRRDANETDTGLPQTPGVAITEEPEQP